LRTGASGVVNRKVTSAEEGGRRAAGGVSAIATARIPELSAGPTRKAPLARRGNVLPFQDKSVAWTSMRWHSSFNQLRTKGGIAGSELVRQLIALSQVSFSGSLDVHPSGLKVTVDPSMCRQVKRKFTKTVLGEALAYRSIPFLCSSRLR
jgi:hypothetical protein